MLDTDEATVVQGVGDAETLLTEEQPHVQFSVGDIVWAKVCGYPWWPCMITTDPEFNLHFRENGKDQRQIGYVTLKEHRHFHLMRWLSFIFLSNSKQLQRIILPYTVF